jgi:tetratricopeptide (TPR) repeat protein
MIRKPDFALVYADMAKTYILKNNFPKAIESSRKAIDLESDLVIAYVYAIHSYLALNDVAAANEWLAKAMAIDPNDSNVQYVKDLVARHGTQQP